MSEPFIAEVRAFGACTAQPPGARGVFPSIVGRSHEVAGYETPTASDVVADLPTGVGVPWEVVLRLSDAETMRAWPSTKRVISPV